MLQAEGTIQSHLGFWIEPFCFKSWQRGWGLCAEQAWLQVTELVVSVMDWSM